MMGNHWERLRFLWKSSGPSSDGPFCFMGFLTESPVKQSYPVKSMGKAQIFDHKKEKEK